MYSFSCLKFSPDCPLAFSCTSMTFSTRLSIRQSGYSTGYIGTKIIFFELFCRITANGRSFSSIVTWRPSSKTFSYKRCRSVWRILEAVYIFEEPKMANQGTQLMQTRQFWELYVSFQTVEFEEDSGWCLPLLHTIGRRTIFDAVGKVHRQRFYFIDESLWRISDWETGTKPTRKRGVWIVLTFIPRFGDASDCTKHCSLP